MKKCAWVGGGIGYCEVNPIPNSTTTTTQNPQQKSSESIELTTRKSIYNYYTVTVESPKKGLFGTAILFFVRRLSSLGD